MYSDSLVIQIDHMSEKVRFLNVFRSQKIFTQKYIKAELGSAVNLFPLLFGELQSSSCIDSKFDVGTVLKPSAVIQY